MRHWCGKLCFAFMRTGYSRAMDVFSRPVQQVCRAEYEAAMAGERKSGPCEAEVEHIRQPLTRRIADGYPERRPPNLVPSTAQNDEDVPPVRAVRREHAESAFGLTVSSAPAPAALISGLDVAGARVIEPSVGDAEDRASRRGLALTCLIAGAGLFFWAGTMTVRDMVHRDLSIRDGATRAGASSRLASARPAEGEPRLPETAALPQTSPAPERVLAMAERLVAESDVVAARAVLSELVAAGDARAIFAMAETFDPNMIAVWKARVAADAGRARRLYRQAAVNGHPEAALRIEALR